MIHVGDLEVEEGQDYEREYTLEGSEFRCRVVDDSSGEGIAFVDFFLVQGGLGAPRTKTVGHAFTKSDGSLHFENVPDGHYSLLAIPETGDHAWAIYPGMRVERGVELEPLSVRLERGCEVRFEIEDEAGRAVPGAQLRLFSPLGEMWDAPWVPASDAEGEVVLSRLRAGSWRCSVRHGEYAEWSGEFVALPEDGGRVRVVLRSR